MKEFFRTLPWRLSRIEFYKKKPFTVVLTVIFSVLLVLTIGIRIFMPDMSNVSVPTASGSFDFSDMDSSEMEEMFGDMSDGDFSGGMDGMPSGDFSEGSDSMPSGDFSGDFGDFSGDFGDFSGDFGDFSGDFPDMSGDSDSSSDDSADDSTVESTRQTGILGFLQGWRSHWLIFFIIYAIADILCIIRLVILSRQKKKQLAEEAKQAREQMLAGEVVHVAHPVKKQKVNSAAVWAIPMVGVILLVAIVNAMTAQTTVSASQTEATTYSGTVETVSMDTVLPGAGTLEEEDADEIELLSDVEVSKWYVSDGDTVEEGDTLALVDTVSVMSAIASIQEQLDALDTELAECEDEEIEETITAAADGRVMAIYAKEDTAVTDTMYEYSALMLISLDGYLCVSMESDADLSVGDSVVVTLSDDATVDGKVSSVISGTITVLVSDEEASLGESVSVATEDGDAVGEGTLSINSALTVTGYAGTVSEIEVSVGDEVESGDTLLTLTDTEYAGTYENLLTQRGELEEAMQELFILYQDPYLYATSDGVISGIDSSSSSDDSDSDDSDSDDDSDDSDSDDDSESSDSSSSSDDSNSNDSDDSDSDSSDGTDSSSNADSDGVVVVSAGVGSAVLSSTVQADDTAAEQLASVTVEENVISISTSSAENDSTFAASTEADTTSDSLDGENTSDNDISSYTNLIGVVTSVADGVATIIYLPDTYTISDYTDLSGIDLDTDLMTQTGTLKTSSSYLMFTYTGSSFSIGTAADLAEGNTVVLAYDSDGSLVWIVCVDVTEDDSDGDGNDDSDSGSSSGSSSGSGSSSSGSSGSGSSASGTDSSLFGSTDGSSVYGSTGSDSSSSGVYGSTDSDSSLYSTYGSTDSDSSSSSIWGSISDYDTSSISTDSTDSDFTYSSSVDLSTLTGVTTDSTTDSLYSDSSDTDTSATEDSSGSYSVSRTTAVSITPQDTMSITITVDELDILSLEVGQTAEVTLDAFPGQSFEGEVTSIDLTGTNSGGSTKFTAVVTIDREEDMLVGMNASASIVIDTTEDVLCITEAALLEEDGAVYVYTTYDEKTDTFGGLVEVTTGISDGENVEILSGLSEGDTYYYSYLDVVNYSTSSFSGGSSSFSSMFSSGGGGGMSMP